MSSQREVLRITIPYKDSDSKEIFVDYAIIDLSNLVGGCTSVKFSGHWVNKDGYVETEVGKRLEVSYPNDGSSQFTRVDVLNIFKRLGEELNQEELYVERYLIYRELLD